MLRRYLEAVSGFAPELVEAAVSICMAGELPGFDGRFAPTPPQFATACRMAVQRQDARDRINGVGRYRYQLPEPPIEHSPASRDRVREMAARFASGQEAHRAEQDEAMRRHADILERTNAEFRPDMANAAVLRRLMKYLVGSPESEENAA